MVTFKGCCVECGSKLEDDGKCIIEEISDNGVVDVSAVITAAMLRAAKETADVFRKKGVVNYAPIYTQIDGKIYTF